MESVTICVATYGSTDWRDLAEERAIPSARLQAHTIGLHEDEGTLASCRNRALDLVDSDLVIFLDADDELEPGYVEAMLRGSADLRAPRVRQLREGRRRPGEPFMPRVWGHRHDCTADCLRQGNWLVIGTCVRTEVLRRAGGFPEGIEWSEDWAAFARCWAQGATVEAVPDAVYFAHVRRDSRNHAPSSDFKLAQHRLIERLVWPDEVPA